MGYNIDYGFSIAQEGSVEGGTQVGYYPGDSEASGTSGLTIAHGVDLSHFTEGELKKAGVSQKDINQVSKYLAYYPKGSYDIEAGPKGDQLTTRTNSLDILTRDEKGDRTGFKIKWDKGSVDNINQYMEEKFAASAKNTYEKLSGKNFENLSKAKQTVLFDLTYNAGTNFIEGKTIRLKQFIADDDWSSVETELRTGKWADKDRDRHKDRAKLLSDEQLDIDIKSMIPNEAVMDTVGQIPN